MAKTKYEELLEVRKLPFSDEREETDKIKLKEIIKDFSAKAESVYKNTLIAVLRSTLPASTSQVTHYITKLIPI